MGWTQLRLQTNRHQKHRQLAGKNVDGKGCRGYSNLPKRSTSKTLVLSATSPPLFKEVFAGSSGLGLLPASAQQKAGYNQHTAPPLIDYNSRLAISIPVS